MSGPTQLRFGAGRRPRLSDAETERRMLAAGRRLVAEQGLSLSLEHLSVEDLIADAGVSRSSSYRRWPTKDAFAADLLLNIAQTARLSVEFAPYADALRAAAVPLLDGINTEQGRRDLVVAAYRALGLADFAATLASESWRSYVVLRAAHVGLPDGDLRERVSAALATTERGFTTARSRALAAASTAIGYRLQHPEVVDWVTLAEMLSATFTGALIRAFADPTSVLATRRCAPFGSTVVADWTLPTLTSGALYFAATVPDPEVVWDAARIASVRTQLTDPSAVAALLWPEGGGGAGTGAE